MAINYAYNYATIDPNTNMCIHVQTTTEELGDVENVVELPVYDPEYLFKYYLNGSWWEDAAGTIPWESSLL